MVVDKINNSDTDIKSTVENIRYLLVDEYQYINTAQENLIKGIHEISNCKLFVLGDDDQSIFGWRGADVNNILEFTQNVNAMTGETLMLGVLVVGWVILFVSMRYAGNKDAILASSFMIAVMAIYFRAMDFSSTAKTVVLILIFAIVFVITLWRRD